MRLLNLKAYYKPEITPGIHLEEDVEDAYRCKGVINIVYTPMPTRGVSKNVRKIYKRKKVESLMDGFLIINRFSMFSEKTNPLLRAFRYFCCSVIQYFLSVRESNIDLVHSGSTPPTQGMLSALVAKKLSKKYGHKVPFVYNLQDIFPDSLVNTGLTSEGSILWKIGRKIEDFTYKNADKIIVISEDFKKNIMAKGVPEEKIVIVPNWVNTENVYPVERDNNKLFDIYNLDKSKFYISYCGNIGHTQNMDMLLDSAKEIASDYPDVCFVLVGDGAAKSDVENRIKAENINNVIMLPFQPYEDIAHVFSLGDIGLIISKPGVGENSVPSKTFSIMAAEKPILASFDKNSELAHLIERVGCGVTVDAGEKEAFVEAIKTFYNKSKTDSEFLSMGKLGREYLKTDLDKDKCVGMYVETLESVCREK